MLTKIDDYRQVAPPGVVDTILRLAERVQGRRFLHVSGGRYGGGTAEILRALVPIMADLGLDAGWEITGGDPGSYATMAALQAALGGAERVIADAALEHYREMTQVNARKLRLEGDLVLVHDVPPMALVEDRSPDGKWLWQCHFDCSQPQRRTWSHVRDWVNRYDATVFSLPKFAPRLGGPQFIIHPSIDPLSDKNRDLGPRDVASILKTLGIAQDKPLLLQVGPFTADADPLGVVNAYRLVKKHFDVRLVLAGTPGDDHDSGAILTDLREVARHDDDIRMLELPPEAHLQINALQRAATVVLQKSLGASFGLGAAEAMWKGKPIVGGVAGGLAQLVIYDVTGYTVHSVEGAAFRIRHLLNNPELIARLGAAGREHIRRSFLITRHLTDYLALLIHLTR
jgi:trehalose synthase